MDKLQKIILVLLVSISGFTWFVSTNQPDMMNIMITYAPILSGLFATSWTAGMAAMMFPKIVPMVLLYNKLSTNEQSISSVETLEETLEVKFHTLKVILFVGIYLAIWALGPNNIV
jgi:predicted metal-binding membrane protein